MANTMTVVSAVALLVVLQAASSIQGNCKGYKIVINSLTTCPGVDSIITPENIRLDLKEDCKLYSTGCVRFRAFGTANVSFWGTPDTKIKMMNISRSNINGCARMTDINTEARTILEAMNVPTACPVAAGAVCSNGTRFVDVSNGTKELDKAAMGKGRYIGGFDTTFDTGRGCILFNITIVSGNKKALPLPMAMPSGMPKFNLPKMPKLG